MSFYHLFNYAMDWIMTKAIAEYRGVQLSSDTWISDIEYADYVVVSNENFEISILYLNVLTIFLIILNLR